MDFLKRYIDELMVFSFAAKWEYCTVGNIDATHLGITSNLRPNQATLPVKLGLEFHPLPMVVR